jgi:hypothetical protein
MRKSMFGIQQPVGICIVPKFCDSVYESLPKEQWSDYRLKNFEMGRPDFLSMLEERYEKRKDVWIEREQHGAVGYHHEMRYRDGVKLGELPVFQNSPNKKRQRIIARQMFRNMTEQEIDEIVEIARMGISFDDLQAALSGKPVVKAAAEGNEDEVDEDADDDESLQEEADAVSAEPAEQGHGIPDAGFDAEDALKVQADTEVGAGCDAVDAYDEQVSSDGDDEEDVEIIETEGVSDTFIQGREETVTEEMVSGEELHEPVDMDKLKSELMSYNPKPRKVKPVPSGAARNQPEILPETKG